jgi:large subunit ribosomal protein L3
MTYVKAKKLKMGQIFKDEEVVPVTLLSLEKEADIEFEVGAKLKVSGTAKGRGFQGVVKRHGFHGGPKTHGQKHTLRAPGSIGSTGPQRVIPGVKMAGRMGSNKVTIKNMEVAAFDKDRGILMLKGAVPGNKGGELKIYVSEKKDEN